MDVHGQKQESSEAQPDTIDLLLDVRHLNLFITAPNGREVQILDDVNLTIARGSTIGIIGESGCGKSMTALSILRLLPEAARLEGQVLLDGIDLVSLPARKMKEVRGSRISMVFQEPMTALDPVFTIGNQIAAALRSHSRISKKAARADVLEMLDAVGIPDPKRRFSEYPHQLSGGMRQRCVIAMALVCRSELLIADEPTTAVDITIQAQLLDLLERLNREYGMAVLMITHDLGVAAEFCDQITVMYAGKVIESAATDELLEHPAHPYTSGLMKAIPKVELRGSKLYTIPGRVPLPGEAPQGCSFHPRCAHTAELCLEQAPRLDEVQGGQADHLVRCVRAPTLSLPGVTSPWDHEEVERA